ncbi:ribonuclease H family protein [Priestia aryabhattai]
MFIAYSDASVKERGTSLAFFIIFEDKSEIRRRIIVDERDNNAAEALALSELLAFLKYYNLKKGTILLDSKTVKVQLKKECKNNKAKKRGKKNRRYLPKGIYKVLEKLQVRTQLITRTRNAAHKICYREDFILSTPISKINRKYYEALETYKDYFMQQSVLEEYRKIHNNPSTTFHEAQINLNKEIWLADLVENTENEKVYEVNDKRIKVVHDTVVKIWEVSYEKLITIGE